MDRVDLTQYDIKPEGMINYLRYNGPHFSAKLFAFAVKQMTKKDMRGIVSSVEPYTKEQVDALLKRYNITLKNNQLYDAVYVATMCRADFLGSSVTDEYHLALYVKDVIDDVDGYDGIVFNRWYADMCRKGIVIDWEEVI